MINNDKAFSKDLYIIDQDCFHEITYRTMPADINGCGWISAYNLRHYLGQDVNYDDVRLEMDEMHYLKVPGPTLMVVMRAYLKNMSLRQKRLSAEKKRLQQPKRVWRVSSDTGRGWSLILSPISARITENSVFSTWRTGLRTARCRCRSSEKSISEAGPL